MASLTWGIVTTHVVSFSQREDGARAGGYSGSAYFTPNSWRRSATHFLTPLVPNSSGLEMFMKR